MGNGIFSIIGSALNAQDLRMSTIASNLANAGAVAKPGEQPYRAHEVVFQAEPASGGGADGPATMGVQIAGIVQSNAPPTLKYDPGNPYANAQGYVMGSNVSPVEEMVNMIDSSNSYSASIAMLQQASRIDQQMINSFEVSE